MAPVVTDPAWRPSRPDAVDRDLAMLWREIADHRGPVARAVMSNLVVFRLRERRTADRPATDASTRATIHGAAAADDLLRDVVARHPSRTIVVEHDRGEHPPGQPVGAQVGISVFGPPAAQYGVEWVVLRSACAEASLPSVVRRFARGDVPTSIWWTDDLPSARVLDPIVATGRQLVYDSRLWRNVDTGVRSLAPLLRAGRVDLADLNWRRLAPLRLALVQPGFNLPVTGATRTRILHRRNERALACLLSGWLASRLHWTGDQWPALVEADLEDEDALRLELAEGDRRLTVRLNGRRVEIAQQGTTPLVIATPGQVAAESIAVELRTLSTDRALREALTSLSHRLAP
jgi:glucose-6-phosphate dehydrogenase assembly protein OpcA